MSSAILYLAIVAIWACVLVPRWLHRSHDAAPEPEVLADETDYAEGFDHGQYGPQAEPDTGPAADPYPAPTGSQAQAGSSDYSDSSDWSDRPMGVAQPGRYDPARPPAPGTGRARVLQARRRMLTMVVALAAVALACVVTGLTRWWTAVPPVGMLLAYALLLREAARADAEVARRAEAYARYARAEAAREAYERAREAQAEARAARLPQPAAEVIDISNRAADPADQPYDQYADATVRAVGD